MIKHSTKQLLALVSAVTLAVISSQAQSADGTLFISGQLSANTCKLNISDPSGSTNNGTRTIYLGTVSPSLAPSNTADATFGNGQTITFGLTSASGTGNCAAGTGNWNIVLDLQAAQVGSATGAGGTARSHLKNAATSNAATNVGVALFGGLSQAGATRIATFLTDAAYSGTKISATNATVSDGAQLFLTAQFVTTSSVSAPTPGLFSATVPLLILYQ
jgi:type 1 fimbria pilin